MSSLRSAKLGGADAGLGATRWHAATAGDDVGRCAGDDVYVRSVNGRGSSWFRAAQDRHAARIRAGGVRRTSS